jgi:hypothetical protein
LKKNETMKKIFILFLLLISAYSYGQSFSDFLKSSEDRSILQCNVDSVTSSLVYLRRKDSPFYGIGVPWKQVRGLYLSDSTMKKRVVEMGNSKYLVSHPSQLSVSSTGVVTSSPVSLTDSLSRLTVSYHLERAGVNLNAGEWLYLLSGIIGTTAFFAKDINQVKTIAGVSLGVAVVGFGVKLSGGNHLILAGQKIRYRK